MAPAPGLAQEAAGDSASADEDVPLFLEGFRLYGSVRGQAAFYSRTTELQGNASRVGFRLTRDFFDLGIQIFGQVELGFRIIDDIANFNVSGNQGGFGRLELVDRRDPVFPRLGFVGFDFGKFGLLTAGKQWSTYYDVSGYTDQFWVFGGRASGTYLHGTDGGGVGTGRANKAITYRNRFGGLGIGAQAQLEANRITGLGSIGGSVQYSFPFGLTVGAAVNAGDVPEVISESILGAKREEWAVVFGAEVEQPRWYAALTYAIQSSHDVRNVDTLTVAFDAKGVELIGYCDLGRRTRISGGFNYLDPEPIPPLDPDFRVLYGVVGGAFYFNAQTLIYAEWRIDASVAGNGIEEPNALVIGVRLDFGLPELQRNDAPPLRFPESQGNDEEAGE
ncbi:MAG: porin [Gemmatimonadota bacterium]|nr:MAG: porin [Gemmatimonadota bacterium]